MSDIFNGIKTAMIGTGVYPDTLNVEADTLGVFLASDDTPYTFDGNDADYLGELFDGVQATEFTGTYTPQIMTTKTVPEDTTNNRAEFHADNVTFPEPNGDTIQFGVIAKQVGGDWTTPADDPLVAYLTSAEFPLPTNGGPVELAWPAEGIVHVT